MTNTIFLTALCGVSILTALVVEGIKTILEEHNKKYYSNTLAGIVAVVLSVLVFAGVIIITGISVDAIQIVYLVSLMIISWLCSMLGYDKVIQAIQQIK